MPTCSRQWSWHHHQCASAVLKTRWPNIYCRDARFCRQQEQMCGQRQSSYTPNSTAARRNWRRPPHSSCRLDSQCSGDRKEESAFHFISNLLAQVTLCHRCHILIISSFPPFCVCLLVLQKKIDTVKELSIIMWHCEHAMHFLCRSPLSGLLVHFTSFYWPLYQSVIGNSIGPHFWFETGNVWQPRSSSSAGQPYRCAWFIVLQPGKILGLSFHFRLPKDLSSAQV